MRSPSASGLFSPDCLGGAFLCFREEVFSEIGLRVRTTHCVALSTLIFATVKNNMLLSSLEVEGVIIHVAHDALSQT
jgi:hypothetical protein